MIKVFLRPQFILLAILVLVVGYFLGGGDTFKGQIEKVVPKMEVEDEGKATEVGEWLTFNDKKTGLMFNYPPEWGVLDMNGSFIVAPKAIVEKYRAKNELGGGYGGGPDFTLQVFVEDGSGNTDIKAESDREATRKTIKLAGVQTTEYIFTWKGQESMFEPGTKTMSWEMLFPAQKVRADLFNLDVLETAKKILESIKFEGKVAEPNKLVGKTTVEVGRQLGAPNFMEENKDKKREIWVYTEGGDSTASYIYFENGVAVETKVDEFNGTVEGDPFLK